MKKFFLLVALLAFSAFGNSDWTDLGRYVFVRSADVDGHTYIIAKGTGEGGVSILHAESCKCKDKPARNLTEDQGPRLFPKAMRLKKYEEQNGICSCCTNHFEFAEMQGDHIVPYSKGGKTVYENLQMLCIRCNQIKGNKYSY